MKKVQLFLFVLVISSVMVFAQTKDLSQKPASFNNPVVTGTSLTSPLTTLNESFENATFPPTGWIKLNPDGGTGWNRQLAGVALPGWTGSSIITTPVGGGTAVGYCTWNTGGATANDQWLITPQITNVQAGDSLYFMLRKSTQYLDNFDVKISTTTPTAAAFTVVVLSKTFPATLTDTAWTLYSFKVGNLVPAGSNIYIGFREWVLDNFNDGGAISMDLVRYVPGVPVPVELTSFTGISNNGNVVLNWATATEKNNRGFEIQKKSGNNNFTTVGFVNGKGTTTETQMYAYTDSKISAGKYTYRLKQLDFNGNSEYSKNIEVEVVNPSKFELNQNYPNPFNPSTKINFALSSDSKVTLKVYNLIGQEVAVLLNGNMSAGTHSVNFNASQLTSGMYLYKLQAVGVDGSSFSSVKKMILNK